MVRTDLSPLRDSAFPQIRCAVALLLCLVLGACGTARRIHNDSVRDVFTIVVQPPENIVEGTEVQLSANIGIREYDQDKITDAQALLSSLEYYWEFKDAGIAVDSGNSTSTSATPSLLAAAGNAVGYPCKLTVWSSDNDKLRSSLGFNLRVLPELRILQVAGRNAIAPLKVTAGAEAVTFSVLTSLSAAPDSVFYQWDFGQLGSCADPNQANPIVAIAAAAPTPNPIDCRVTVSNSAQTTYADFKVTVLSEDLPVALAGTVPATAKVGVPTVFAYLLTSGTAGGQLWDFGTWGSCPDPSAANPAVTIAAGSTGTLQGTLRVFPKLAGGELGAAVDFPFSVLVVP